MVVHIFSQLFCGLFCGMKMSLVMLLPRLYVFPCLSVYVCVSLLETLSILEYLSEYVVPSWWVPLSTKMSQMTILSLIAGCFWSSRPPSSSPQSSQFSFWNISLACDSNSGGAVYVRKRSAWRFHSWIVPSGHFLRRHRLSLYLYWAIQLSPLRNEASWRGKQTLVLGGKIYWVGFAVII